MDIHPLVSPMTSSNALAADRDELAHPRRSVADFRIQHLRDRLGKSYEFQAILGQGAFGTVYLVRNVRLNRLEALKVLSENHAEDDAARFIREATIVASLDHPSIVKVYDYGEADGIVWFSMQHIDGPSLRTELTGQGRLPQAMVLHLAVPLLDALSYSHQMGTVHRDIKPSNILLNLRGRPFLMDFGIAKSNADALKTATGSVLGTPAYISPEQLQGQVVDGRSDLYSLAIAMYEMLAGKPPFHSETAIQTLMMRLQEPPEPLSQHCPEVDRRVEAAIMRGLAKSPGDRYSNAESMHEALREVLREEPEHAAVYVSTSAPQPVAIEPAPPSTAQSGDPDEAPTVHLRKLESREEQQRSGRSGWPLKMLGLAALLAFLLATVLFYRPWNRTPDAHLEAETRPSSPLPPTEEQTQLERDTAEGDTAEGDTAEGDTAEGDTEVGLSTTAGDQGTQSPEPPADATPRSRDATPAAGDSTSASPPPPERAATTPPTQDAELQPASSPQNAPSGAPASTATTPRPTTPAPSPTRRPVIAPKIVVTAEPTLPTGREAACRGRSVILSLQVGENGRVTSTRVLRPGPELCNRAARAAAKAFIFDPARDAQGLPVTASSTINIQFGEVDE